MYVLPLIRCDGMQYNGSILAFKQMPEGCWNISVSRSIYISVIHGRLYGCWTQRRGSP